MAAGPGGREVGRISIRVVPDVSGFREKVRAELAALENELAQEINVDVDLDTTKARASMSVLMSKLRAEAQRGVTVETRVDKDRINGFMSSIGTGAAGAASGLGGMGRNLAIVAAVAAFAAPALALISGVLITLPAILSAVIIPIAALALGMDGIKKAAEVLKPGFEALKATMNQATQDQFTPVFEKLNAIFPSLSKTLPLVTQGVADMARGLVDSVTSASGLSLIENIISRVGGLLSALRPTITKLSDGFLNLTSSVADHFPGVATFIEGFADRFKSWVSEISAKDWFGNSPLDTAIGNFRIALQSILDLIAQLGATGFQALSDPKMGENIKKFVDGLTRFVKDSLPAFLDLFDGLATAMDKFISAVDKGDALLQKLGITPKPGEKPEKVNPSTEYVEGSPLDDLSKWMTEAEAATQAFLQSLWAQVSSFFVRIGTDLGAYFTQQWATISTAGSQVWGTISAAATTAWATITTAVSTATAGISSFFTGIPGALASAWAGLGGIASAAWQAVTSAVSAAWEGIKTAVSAGIDAVIAFVSAIPGRITGAIGDLSGLLVAAGTSLMNGLLSGIKSGVQAVLDFASGIADKIAAVKGPLSYDKVVLQPAGEALMDGLSTGLENGLSPILQQAKDMATQIFQAFKDVFGTAPQGVSFNLGGAGGNGLGAIPAQLNQITPALKDFQSTVSNGISPAKLDDATKAQIDQIKQQQKLLEIQAKQATLDSKGDVSKEKKKELQDLAAQYRLQKDQLGLQADQLSYAEKYGGAVEGTNAAYDGLNQKIGEAGSGLLEANLTQGMQDLGIGGGAITAAIDQGIGLAKQYVFNVGSMDDALAGQRNLVNKDALQFTQR